MMSLRNEYKKNGYIILKSIFNSNEIKIIREYIENKFELQKNPNLRNITSDNIINDKNLFQIFFEKEIVNNLKIIFENDLTYIPDFVIQINSFGQKNNSYKPGWHVDSASEKNATYLLNDDYDFAKMGIFLQDNTLDFGGGILLAPKAHKIYFKFLPSRLVLFIKKIQDKIFSKIRGKSILSEAGDVIIFDSRIPHASALPNLNKNIKQSIEEKNKIDGLGDNSKYVFYCNVTNSKYSELFMKHSVDRRLNENNNKYFDYVLRKFPDDYSDHFVEIMKKNNINIGNI